MAEGGMIESPTKNRRGLSEDEDSDSSGDLYVLYKERREWSDIVPIAQDEGNVEVVQIEYSDKFIDVYDYFRGVVKVGDKTERVLTLTADAVVLNAANYTVWQYRRDVLQALKVPCLITKDGLSVEFEQEFAFSRQMIERNQKNYQVWHHRKALVSFACGYDEEKDRMELKDKELKDKLARIELDLTEGILQSDAKNYHAWQHRSWIIGLLGTFDKELDFVSSLIEDDVRNNSAWNQRYFVLSNFHDLSMDKINEECEYTWDQILLAPSNESPWHYMRGLLLLVEKNDAPSLPKFRSSLIPKCYKLYEQGGRSIPLMSFFVEIVLSKLETEGWDEEAFNQGNKVVNTLDEKDTIRDRYWSHIRKKLETTRPKH